ncbi:porin [Rhizobacter sp. J219]|uniref:porin n=1 Tax=Rhizobacter sp. J219 TaxID=2898430 RepID=UPI002150A1AA|nr:porin [Rhizobacter sp. J219]MCR5885275.1 porin [Rhizobacter sp. J219]
MNRSEKKLVFAACAVAGAFGAVSASAQSSVTLFGVADTSARYVKNENVGSIKSLASGANQTSRLGFRGIEDLGGGWSAGFHLEHGISVDTGTAASSTQFWDRRATVSLLAKPLGEIRIGRDFVPSYVSWGRHDPFGYVGVASSGTFISATPVGPIRSAYGTGGNTTVRSSNAVQYLLPSGLGGVDGALMVAAGEGGTAANGQHKLVGGRLGFTHPLFGITAAHDRVENDLTVLGSHTDTVVGGHLSLSFMRLTLATRQFKYGNAKQSNLLVGATVPVGAGEVKASFNRANLQGRVGATVIDANDASQIGLGYVHALSKRTALYTTASRISNKGAASFAIPGGPAGLAGGRDSTGFEAGLRHNF